MKNITHTNAVPTINHVCILFLEFPLFLPRVPFILSPSFVVPFSSSSSLAVPTPPPMASLVWKTCMVAGQVLLSLSMAWNFPGYVKMLVDDVRDLDEWGWEEDKEIADLSFKDEILRVAAQKGDKEKIAYLETLGLSLLVYQRCRISLRSYPLLSHTQGYVHQATLLFSR